MVVGAPEADAEGWSNGAGGTVDVTCGPFDVVASCVGPPYTEVVPELGAVVAAVLEDPGAPFCPGTAPAGEPPGDGTLRTVV